MNTDTVLDDLRSRIEAGYPLLFLQTWEELRWERELAELSLEIERGLVTWTITAGLQPPPENGNIRVLGILATLAILVAVAAVVVGYLHRRKSRSES